MFATGGVLIYLAIAKEYEPMLVLLAFGTIKVRASIDKRAKEQPTQE